MNPLIAIALILTLTACADVPPTKDDDGFAFAPSAERDREAIRKSGEVQRERDSRGMRDSRDRDFRDSLFRDDDLTIPRRR